MKRPTQPLIPTVHPDADRNAYSHANTYSHADDYANSDEDTVAHSYGHAYIDPFPNSDAYANSGADRDANSNSDGHGHIFAGAAPCAALYATANSRAA